VWVCCFSDSFSTGGFFRLVVSVEYGGVGTLWMFSGGGTLDGVVVWW
jgi:hypothetical protein